MKHITEPTLSNVGPLTNKDGRLANLLAWASDVVGSYRKTETGATGAGDNKRWDTLRPALLVSNAFKFLAEISGLCRILTSEIRGAQSQSFAHQMVPGRVQNICNVGLIERQELLCVHQYERALVFSWSKDKFWLSVSYCMYYSARKYASDALCLLDV